MEKIESRGSDGLYSMLFAPNPPASQTGPTPGLKQKDDDRRKRLHAALDRAIDRVQRKRQRSG
jgi:hypothetical protein